MRKNKTETRFFRKSIDRQPSQPSAVHRPLWEYRITRIRRERERETLPLRLIDIILLLLLLDTHDHAVLGDAHMSLLHTLGRLVRHIVRHRVNGIADETSHSEKYEQDQEREEVREGGHNLKSVVGEWESELVRGSFPRMDAKVNGGLCLLERKG